MSHFPDSEEKFSSYTQRSEERRLWGRIMLKQFFSPLCSQLGKDRKHQMLTLSETSHLFASHRGLG